MPIPCLFSCADAVSRARPHVPRSRPVTLNLRLVLTGARLPCISSVPSQVHPIFYNGSLQLFAARLQDYSYRMSRLVSLSPAQFCKSGDLFQMRIRLSDVASAQRFRQPRCVDVTDCDLGYGTQAEASSSSGSSTTGTGISAVSVGDVGEGVTTSGATTYAGKAPVLPVKHVRRLGFGGLALEPEYLLDRLRHECAELDLPCQTQELVVQGSEVMRMEVSTAGMLAEKSDVGARAGGSLQADEGVRAIVHVLPEDSEGTYSISMMRLMGNTFAFHSLYRSLRERLQDITLPVMPTTGQ